MRNANYDNTEHKVKIVTHYENYSHTAQRSLKTDDLDILLEIARLSTY